MRSRAEAMAGRAAVVVVVGGARNTSSYFLLSLSLSVSVWSSEGTLAVQCSKARSRIHSNTDELLNSAEWM